MTARLTSPTFVGREPELAELAELVVGLGDPVSLGEAAVALVGGDAGIGKSRFVAEVASRHPETLTVVGGCVEVAASLPFAPYVEVLDRLAHELGPDRLRQLAGRSRAELARLVPSLGPVATTADDATGQAQLFHAVREVLTAVGADRSLVVVIEDLHWADRSTLDLTAFLARGRIEGRVLLVATYRTDDLHRRHPLRPVVAELTRLPQVRHLVLGGLGPLELERMLTQLRGEPIPVDRLDDIAARSEGNAFYAEELLVADGAGDRLPSGLRDLLLLRLDRAHEHTARVVRTAAVAGRHIPHRLLEVVMGAPPDELDGALREAIEHGLLVVDGDGYRFRHALQREAIYEEVLPGERVALHRAFAEALVAAPELSVSDVCVDAELAYHWYAAREVDAAFRSSVAAARAAEACYAHREALDHCERALELWGAAAPEARRETDRQELLHAAVRLCFMTSELRRGLGHATAAVELAGDDAAARAQFLVWRALFQWTLADGDAALATSRAALAALPDRESDAAATVLASHARLLGLGGEKEEAATVAEQAVAAARAVGNRAVEGRALNSLGVALSDTRPTEALDALRQALALARETGGAEDRLRAHINVSSVLCDIGDYRAAVATADEGIAWARDQGLDPSVNPFLLLNRIEALMRGGHLREAEASLAGVSATDGDMNEIFWRTTAAALHVYRGRIDEGAVEHRRAEQLSEKVVDPQFRGPQWEVAGLIAFWQRDPARARQAVGSMPDAPPGGWPAMARLRLLTTAGRTEADAAGLTRQDGDDSALADHLATLATYRQHARTIVDANPGEPLAPALAAVLVAEESRASGGDAVAAWGQARTAFEEVAAVLPYDRLVNGWRHAEALLAADWREEAAALLAETHAHAVRDGYDGIRDACEALARRAKVVLDGAAPQDGVPDLTPREQEVLALVAAGRTNRQIGEALFISPKTASVHVSNILGKLGAANRSEAGAIAHRLGL